MIKVNANSLCSCLLLSVIAAGPNTPLHQLTCMVSAGYFVFDFFWCLYYQSEGNLYYLFSVHVSVLITNTCDEFLHYLKLCLTAL